MAKPRSMTVLSVLARAVAMILMVIPESASPAAQNSEQVVFSGIGQPPVSSEPFGFWIWCQNEQAAPSRGRYETDCNGALYFYARGIVSHVVGEITEPSEGTYVMDVASTDGSISCTLSNLPPIQHGPNNEVSAGCIINGTSVSGLGSMDAIVNATGP